MVKLKAASAVTQPLMMGGKTPRTCEAERRRRRRRRRRKKSQDNKLKNCCIWLVISLNCTTMHGLTNLKL
jgi:hypothetical protein